MHLYGNPDTTTGLVREFEEKAARTERRSLVKDAQRSAEELGIFSSVYLIRLIITKEMKST